jgi:hypothetical protein
MTRLIALVVSLPIVAACFTHAQAAKPDNCSQLVGTYLTRNFAKGAEESPTSRSLMSFVEGGQVLFVDSGEGGEKGFAPFTDGTGAWRCVVEETGKTGARLIALDFTFVAQGDQKAQIGRLDIEVSYDETAKTISGTAVLYFLPLMSDPLSSAELGEGRHFKLTGVRVEAP